MKKKLIALTISIIALGGILTGCQSAARNFGGTTTVDLPKNKKLMEATWKEDSLWYLVRDMREGEEAETYEFKESSNMGVVEGKVIFKESKDGK